MTELGLKAVGGALAVFGVLGGVALLSTGNQQQVENKPQPVMGEKTTTVTHNNIRFRVTSTEVKNGKMRKFTMQKPEHVIDAIFSDDSVTSITTEPVLLTPASTPPESVPGQTPTAKGAEVGFEVGYDDLKASGVIRNFVHFSNQFEKITDFSIPPSECDNSEESSEEDLEPPEITGFVRFLCLKLFIRKSGDDYYITLLPTLPEMILTLSRLGYTFFESFEIIYGLFMDHLIDIHFGWKGIHFVLVGGKIIINEDTDVESEDEQDDN